MCVQDSKTSGKTWVAKQAGLLVQRGECSIRAAMDMANLKYGATGVGSVSYGTVFNYAKDELREPLQIGRPAILPVEFTASARL